MIAIGIDPGLSSTGLVAVQSAGPGLPRLLVATTIVQAKLDRDDRMAPAVSAWVKTFVLANHPADTIGLEDFEHRGWLTNSDGSPRRVSHAAAMGQLVGEIHGRLSGLVCPVRVIAAGTSKAGFPSAQRDLRRLLPQGLRNSHERSAFMVANAALALHRAAAPARLDPNVVPLVPR